MNRRLIVTGTDTDIGKTVFCAALVNALDGEYWKPVQSGLDGPTDSETVAELTGRAHATIHPEAYRLKVPASPHYAAARDGVEIDPDRLQPPQTKRPLVIEGAGGLLVPLTTELLYADLFTRWDAPIIIVARTGLGTINHSLLTIEAARSRGLDILGVAFVGESVPDSTRTICAMGKVKRLGRLPFCQPLDRTALAQAFADNFDIEDFR